MSALCAAGGTRSLMNAPSYLHISFCFVPSRFMAPPPGQPVATPSRCCALSCGQSGRPRRPAIRWSACHPGLGADPARARGLGRTAACLPPAAPGPAVLSASVHTACCAAGQSPVTALACQVQWVVDGAGPGRQASGCCPSVRALARYRTGSSTVSQATAPGPQSPARTVPDGRAVTACPWRGPAGRRLR
jgi:hypothetical protein